MLTTLRRASVVLTSCPSTRSLLLSTQPHVQVRTFIDAFLNSALGPCPLRKVSHTKVIPYSQSAVFKAVSDVSGYPTFLPFTVSSQVTTRDTAGYPTRAKLKIGYDKLGLSENWDSVVHCDPQNGVVEAKSSPETSGGLFELLSAKWHIDSAEHSPTASTTRVNVQVHVKFRNSIYDQMFSQVEDKLGATMISAFEKRVQEIESQKIKEPKINKNQG